MWNPKISENLGPKNNLKKYPCVNYYSTSIDNTYCSSSTNKNNVNNNDCDDDDMDNNKGTKRRWRIINSNSNLNTYTKKYE